MGGSCFISIQESCNAANFLYKTFLHYICHKEIVSNQGCEFCNELVDHVELLTGFQDKVTSAYHAQSKCLDERMNQTFKTQLKKLLNQDQDNWDTLTDNFVFAYNTTH